MTKNWPTQSHLWGLASPKSRGNLAGKGEELMLPLKSGDSLAVEFSLDWETLETFFEGPQLIG